MVAATWKGLSWWWWWWRLRRRRWLVYSVVAVVAFCRLERAQTCRALVSAFERGLLQSCKMDAAARDIDTVNWSSTDDTRTPRLSASPRHITRRDGRHAGRDVCRRASRSRPARAHKRHDDDHWKLTKANDLDIFSDLISYVCFPAFTMKLIARELLHAVRCLY